MRLSQHVLRVPELEPSVAFYRDCFGMRATVSSDRCELRFGDGPDATLVLSAARTGAVTPPSDDDAYWKLAIMLRDVDAAVTRLRAAGVTVGQPRQVADVAYLCHLTDPAGNIVELVQHDFAQDFHPAPLDDALPLGQPATLGLSTLRVLDVDRSLAFYRNVLGMRLLSRQEVSPARFTLYFLASTDDIPPDSDVDAVVNRPWLWRRPFTLRRAPAPLGSARSVSGHRARRHDRAGCTGARSDES